MKAMVIDKTSSFSSNKNPLRIAELPKPSPAKGEVLIEVSVCGVCHTELDEIEGRTPPPHFPVVPGHQVVGRVIGLGEGVHYLKTGDRIGVAWIYDSCGECEYCQRDMENLCDHFLATGRDVNGGYAEFMCVPERSAYKIPEVFSDSEAAPLLCAGAIGYRSLRLSNIGDGQKLGLTGFGASAHLVLKLARFKYPRTNIYVFARSEKERHFALELGAVWAGDTLDPPPEKLDSIIDTTPAWTPVIEALKHLKAGGRLVINAIRKEETDKEYLLKLDYPTQLWMEKEIKSVANVEKRDVSEFLELAAKIPIKPEYQEYPLEDANRVLHELKERKIRGAKILRVNQ